jgi:hypothetical protein
MFIFSVLYVKKCAKIYPYKPKHRAPIKISKKPLTSGGAAVEPAVGPGPDPGAPLT